MGIETGLIALGTAIGTKDLIIKLLGPSIEFFGDELKEFNKRRLENIRKIFIKATEKVGQNIEKPGNVPPIILKEIIETGSYYSDDIFIEYYSGILASSRSIKAKDDIGKVYTQLIHRLSYFQLKAHYIIYMKLKKSFDGMKNCELKSVRKTINIKFKGSEFNDIMEFSQDDLFKSYNIVGNILIGLSREDIIEKKWSLVGKIDGDYIFSVQPGLTGYRLFIWSQGQGDTLLEFLDKKLEFKSYDCIKME